MPKIRKKPPDIIDSQNRSEILSSSLLSNNVLEPDSKSFSGIQMLEASDETLASGNNELSDFSETPTKPLDTKMMATSILPSESPTGVLFPPVPNDLLDRISATIALLTQSSTKYGGSITPAASVSISTGNDLNVLPPAPEDYPIPDAMHSLACTQESLDPSSIKINSSPKRAKRSKSRRKAKVAAAAAAAALSPPPSPPCISSLDEFPLFIYR